LNRLDSDIFRSSGLFDEVPENVVAEDEILGNLLHFTLRNPRSFLTQEAVDPIVDSVFSISALPIIQNISPDEFITDFVDPGLLNDLIELFVNRDPLAVLSELSDRFPLVVSPSSFPDVTFDTFFNELSLPVALNYVDSAALCTLADDVLEDSSIGQCLHLTSLPSLKNLVLMDPLSFVDSDFVRRFVGEFTRESHLPVISNRLSPFILSEIIPDFSEVTPFAQINVDSLSIVPKAVELYVSISIASPPITALYDTAALPLISNAANDDIITGIVNAPLDHLTSLLLEDPTARLADYRIQPPIVPHSTGFFGNFLRGLVLPVEWNTADESDVLFVPGPAFCKVSPPVVSRAPYVHPTERRLRFPFTVSAALFLPKSFPLSANSADDVLDAIVSVYDPVVPDSVAELDFQPLIRLEFPEDLSPPLDIVVDDLFEETLWKQILPIMPIEPARATISPLRDVIVDILLRCYQERAESSDAEISDGAEYHTNWLSSPTDAWRRKRKVVGNQTEEEDIQEEDESRFDEEDDEEEGVNEEEEEEDVNEEEQEGGEEESL
jgi:hypothetical protein